MEAVSKRSSPMCHAVRLDAERVVATCGPEQEDF